MKKLKYGVEHALELQARNMALCSKKVIYNDKDINNIRSRGNFHIYMIGTHTNATLTNCFINNSNLFIEADVSGKHKIIKFSVPDNAKLVEISGDTLVDIGGELWFPSLEEVCEKLNINQKNGNFNILYIGQSYGTAGSRDALDRLKKHETFQKIAVSGIDPDSLHFLLLDVNDCGGVVTIMNPKAENQDENKSRIDCGFGKINGTTNEEVVSIFEACLIKYFNPKFNRIFANSFPSTNLKVLSECYKKDFSLISAEVNTEELNITLSSDSRSPQEVHRASFHLHNDEDRKAFFFVDIMNS